MGFGGSQNKYNMRWRFFKGFKQSVGGTGTEHMDFIYNIDLVAGLVRGVIYLLAEAPDVIDTGVASCVDFYDVQSPGFGYCLTHGAFVTGFTVATGEAIDRFGQRTTGTGFTCSPGATKKIGMRYAPTSESVE